MVNACRLLPALMDRGVDVVGLAIYQAGGTTVADVIESHGVPCRRLYRERFSERMVPAILDVIRDVQPDVFVPNISVQAAFAARYARDAGIPTILVSRSVESYSWGFVDTFVTGDPEWAVSGLVCVSEELRKGVEARGFPSKRLATIPSGVPVPPRQSDQEGPLRLAYVGALKQQTKRILDLVRSMICLLRGQPDITVTFFGDGPERAQCEEEIVAAGLSGRAQFAGLVPCEQIQEQLIHYHVILLVSDAEGMPGALMDGMACGLVPVSLDTPGGLRELVIHEETGLLVGDRHESLHAAIRRLAGDSELRKRLSVSAQRHVIENYSVSVAAHRWETFCGELLAEAPGRSPIHVPRRLRLPPVHPDLAQQDRRRPRLPKRAMSKVGRMFAGKRAASGTATVF